MSDNAILMIFYGLFNDYAYEWYLNINVSDGYHS